MSSHTRARKILDLALALKGKKEVPLEEQYAAEKHDANIISESEPDFSPDESSDFIPDSYLNASEAEFIETFQFDDILQQLQTADNQNASSVNGNNYQGQEYVHHDEVVVENSFLPPAMEDNLSSAIEKPVPKKRTQTNPGVWKRNVEVQKRLKGEEYKTVKGKVITAKPLKAPRCRNRPKHFCCSQVLQNKRIEIYNEFHSLKTLHNQRQFILQHVSIQPKKRTTKPGPSRRSNTKTYTFMVDGDIVKVCREFFLDTLNVTEGLIRGAFTKKSAAGVLKPDERGKHSKFRKFKDEQFIREHILSFLAVESHYTRSKTDIMYLDSALNIASMYDMYKKKCVEQNKQTASLEKYRRVFREYKLSFHKPKKDICKRCIRFSELSADEKKNEGEMHLNHLQNKEVARKCRDEDKSSAQSDATVLAFNFDLQAVLSTPKGSAGPFFYVRKLAVYNLTIYNIGNSDVQCYLWDETEGKRGSVEISTCIFKYITSRPQTKHIKMMSDSCGGQQKNFNFVSMCLYLVKSQANLEIIDHKFFESGHSQMECDSIHSKIEQKTKNIPVYTPDGWCQIIRLARKNPNPFNVTTLEHEDFLDFGTRKNFSNPCSNIDGKRVGLHDAVWIQYKKCSPDSVFIKTEFNQSSFFELKSKKSKTCVKPTCAHKKRINISSAKKNDLLKLCKEYQIPRNHHKYYESLPSSDNVRDALPEPDILEDEVDLS